MTFRYVNKIRLADNFRDLEMPFRYVNKIPLGAVS